MVAGPYTAGPGSRAADLATLNRAALALFRRGHVTAIGVNMALPVIAAADGDAFDEVMMPLALAERCDGCLRIGGPSAGADAELACFRERGLPLWHRLEDIPPSHDFSETPAFP